MKKIIFSIIFIIILFFFGFFVLKNKKAEETSAAAPRSGLVGWWTMDTNDMSPTGATLYDRSGQNNHGTVIGTTTSTGRINQARNFNGNTDYISKSSPTFIDNTQGTYSMWFKWDGVVEDKVFAAVSVNGSTDDEFWFAYFRPDLNKEIRINLVLNGTTSMTLKTANNILTDTKWHHWAVTSDGSTIKAYLDGNNTTLTAESGANSGQWLASATDANIFTIGGLMRATFYAGSFGGLADDVRVYNYALSAQEVSQLYNSAKTTYINSAVKSASSTAQLVGYWTMDTNDMSPTGATLYDRSGQNNHGTVVGTTTSTGRIAQARTFNGTSDWINAGASAGNYTNNFTLSAWVKTGGTGGNERIIARRAAGGDQYDMYSGATLGLSFYTGAVFNSNVPINDNKWHLTTVVINGANSKFYVDGTQAGNTFNPTITSRSVNLEIGSIFNGVSSFMNGAIDDVRIYNYALSAQEVANLYSAAKTRYVASAPKEGLVGYWTMDANDNSGGRMLDKSGRGNHGQMTGTTTSTGRIAQARTFNGTSDFVDVGVGAGSLNQIGNTLTISAWIKPANLSRGTIYSNNYDAGAGSLQFGTSVINGTGALEVYIPGVYVAMTTPGLINASTWSHVVYTRTGTGAGTHKIYINGVSQTLTTDAADNFVDNSSAKFIGQRGSLAMLFPGSIDDVRIYNRALSSAEVSQLYQSAKINYVR